MIIPAKPLFTNADPQDPVFIYHDMVDMITRNSIGIIGLVPESFNTFSIIAVQPVIGADPDKPAAILRYTIYIIAGKSVSCSKFCKIVINFVLGYCNTMN